MLYDFVRLVLLLMTWFGELCGRLWYLGDMTGPMVSVSIYI